MPFVAEGFRRDDDEWRVKYERRKKAYLCSNARVEHLNNLVKKTRNGNVYEQDRGKLRR